MSQVFHSGAQRRDNRTVKHYSKQMLLHNCWKCNEATVKEIIIIIDSFKLQLKWNLACRVLFQSEARNLQLKSNNLLVVVRGKSQIK